MTLLLEGPDGRRELLAVGRERLVIGRGETAGCRLRERDVSRRHARLERAGDALFVEDLGSLTGTRVNGAALTGRHRLRPGDLIEIGAHRLTLAPEEVARSSTELPPVAELLDGGPAARRAERRRRLTAALLAVLAAATAMVGARLVALLAR